MSNTSGRVNPFTRRRALRLSDSARAVLVRAPVVEDRSPTLTTRVEGIDPIRVLLFGSGALIGYGVSRRRDAVDGHLAELLAEHTARGVTIESRVRLGLPTDEAVTSLGGAGTVTFQAAVWCPRFGEELAHRSIRRARAQLRAMLADYREGSSVPLVVCQLPDPLGDDWRTRLRRPRVAAFNAMLREEAGRVTDVRAAATGTYRPTDVTSTLGAGWHRGLAEHLLPPLLEALRMPARRRPETPSPAAACGAPGRGNV